MSTRDRSHRSMLGALLLGAGLAVASLAAAQEKLPPKLSTHALDTYTIKPGRYQAVAHIGDYYKSIGAKLPSGYHTKLTIEFEIYDAKAPHHLPFQITPWTQSTSVLPG